MVKTLKKQNKNEIKRGKFLAGLTASKGLNPIHNGMKASGSSRQEYYRLRKLLAETHDIKDRPRSGSPMYYTPERMQLCLDILLEDDTGMFTAKELNATCMERGFVRKGSYKQWMLRLKAYVKSLGYKLTTTSHGCVFFMAQADVAPRLGFAKKYLPTVENDMKTWLIINETTIEQCPHPKGRCAIRPIQ